jgi:hypothetical protein
MIPQLPEVERLLPPGAKPFSRNEGALAMFPRRREDDPLVRPVGPETLAW